MSQNGNAELGKFNIRNVIALIFVVGYFAFLFLVTGIIKITPAETEDSFRIGDDPVITMLMGIMSASLVLIVQFFFRRGTPQ